MARDILNVGGFVIGRRIGTGARSTIYMATNLSEKTEIALKRVIYNKPEDTRIFEQMQSEFKVAQKVDHPYVRKCYKLKKLRGLFGIKEMLLSMEYFEGESLQDCPTLSLVDVLLVFRMVTAGLNAMHQHGYVHCDIKPNNILFNKSAGSIKIIDLGQSCKIGTVKRRIQGTPDYIAPEQVKRKPLGPKTDVFNLGATMYWALTGKNVKTLIPKANEGLSFESIEPCRSPNEISSRIPVEISDLIMDCVREDSTERPQNMVYIMSSLDKIIHKLLGDKIRSAKDA